MSRVGSSRQQGVAMLIALMVVALATTAAAWMATRQNLDVRRTQNIMLKDQAYIYVLAAEKWVMSMLNEDLRRNNAIDDWDETQMRARGLTVPIEDGQLTGYIRDLNRCFNLNNLVEWNTETNAWVQSEADVAIFKRFVQFINEEAKEAASASVQDEMLLPYEINELDKQEADSSSESTGLSESTSLLQGSSLLSEDGKKSKKRKVRRQKPIEIPETIVYKIVDWIDSDIDPYLGMDGEGAEDMAYSRLKNPYLTPNNLMTHISELRLIDKIYDKKTRSEIFRALQPHVCALPRRTKINVNTAPATLIAALIDGVSLNEAESLINEAHNNPHKNADEFTNKLMTYVVANDDDDAAVKRKQEIQKILQDRTGVATQFFEAVIEAEVGDAKARLQSLLYRTSTGNVLVLSRAQGRI